MFLFNVQSPGRGGATLWQSPDSRPMWLCTGQVLQGAGGYPYWTSSERVREAFLRAQWGCRARSGCRATPALLWSQL